VNGFGQTLDLSPSLACSTWATQLCHNVSLCGCFFGLFPCHFYILKVLAYGIQFFLGRPLFLFLSVGFQVRTCFGSQTSSMHWTWPNQRNRFFLIVFSNVSIAVLFLTSVWLAQLVRALAAPTHVRSCVQEVRVRSSERTSLTLASIPSGR